MTEEQKRAMGELAALSEELGLYDLPLQVCLAHMRFAPCRKKEGCFYSIAAGDIERVMKYQRENFGD